MRFVKCPSCEHEVYDRSAANCPFCGHKLGSFRQTGSPGGGLDQRTRLRIVLLVASLLLALAGGLVAFLTSAKV